MGIIFVLTAGIMWGMMGIFVRGLAGANLTNIEICAVRIILSALLMLILLLVFKRDALRIKLKDIWCFICSGLISLTFMGYCYFSTIQTTSLSVAAVLLYTSPVFVLVISAIVFKEKVTKSKIIAIILAIIGCAFVTGIFNGKQSVTMYGLIIGVCSGLGYGLYSIFGRCAINRGYKALTITFYSFLFSAISLTALVNPLQIAKKLMSDAPMSNTLNTLGIVLVVTVIPYVLYTLGLAKVENSKAAVIACIEPIVATLIGFLMFNERLGVIEILGVILVLTAIVKMNRN